MSQPTNLTEKLSLWGHAYAAARDAERAAQQQRGGPGGELQRRASLLRLRADRLHREIYGELGATVKRDHGDSL